MEATALPIFRDQLLDRRQKLETAAATLGPADEVARLLQEVDVNRLPRHREVEAGRASFGDKRVWDFMSKAMSVRRR